MKGKLAGAVFLLSTKPTCQIQQCPQYFPVSIHLKWTRLFNLAKKTFQYLILITCHDTVSTSSITFLLYKAVKAIVTFVDKQSVLTKRCAMTTVEPVGCNIVFCTNTPERLISASNTLQTLGVNKRNGAMNFRLLC